MKFSTHLRIYTGLAKRKAIFLYNHEGVRGFIGVVVFLYVGWRINQYMSQFHLSKGYR